MALSSLQTVQKIKQIFKALQQEGETGQDLSAGSSHIAVQLLPHAHLPLSHHHVSWVGATPQQHIPAEKWRRNMLKPKRYAKQWAFVCISKRWYPCTGKRREAPDRCPQEAGDLPVMATAGPGSSQHGDYRPRHCPLLPRAWYRAAANLTRSCRCQPALGVLGQLVSKQHGLPNRAVTPHSTLCTRACTPGHRHCAAADTSRAHIAAAGLKQPQCH